MQFPELTEEYVEIERLLLVKSARFDVRQFTSFIGPQASGKSVVAKCIYFFRSYLRDIFFACIDEEFSRPSFNKIQIDEFETLFRGVESLGPYSARWASGNLSIQISRAAGNNRARIQLSDQLVRLVTGYRNDFKRFQRRQVDDTDDDLRLADTYSYSRSSPERRKFAHSLPSVHFVPASRAFFSVIQEEVFTLLSVQQSLDPLLIHFGRFYELFRAQHDRSRRARRDSKAFERPDIKAILGGIYTRRRRKDIIKTDWGEVPLRASSSGQQEVLPLILSLLEYPRMARMNDLLIIEEPEAHLFPEAQKAILELMVEVSVESRCKMLFTTHSPYILACLNNEIALRNWDRGLLGAYHVASGKCHDIFDDDDRLIDISAMDEVSSIIAQEYLEAISDSA